MMGFKTLYQKQMSDVTETTYIIQHRGSLGSTNKMAKQKENHEFDAVKWTYMSELKFVEL